MNRSVAGNLSDFYGSNPASFRDYFLLLKPRVMALVVFTGWIGLCLAPGSIHPFIAFIAVSAIALGSGAAGAINMWWERETDAKMQRTKNRPLPAGRMTPDQAIEFATIMAFASVVIMAVGVNLLSGLLLLMAILFYVGIYTIWLKPRTPQNIVIGGAAGALPPVIGWTAVTGSLSLEPLLLFLIIFLWTPPHFWALSLYRSEDYAKAGIPMLPNVAGHAITKKQMLLYTLLLVGVSVLPYVIGSSGFIYLATATLLGVCFMVHSVRVRYSNNESHFRAMFGFSILYLFLLFFSLLIDHWLL